MTSRPRTADFAACTLKPKTFDGLQEVAVESDSLLKTEINQTLGDLHDFSKWKIIVVSALAAAAMGLGVKAQNATDWLLVFAPYACAYIDLNCYQYLLRVLLIAKVLRESSSDVLLLEYENQCESCRQKGFYGLGLFAQLGCSLAFSTILPVLGYIRSVSATAESWELISLLVAWVIGLCAVVLFYLDFKRRSGLLLASGHRGKAPAGNPGRVLPRG